MASSQEIWSGAGATGSSGSAGGVGGGVGVGSGVGLGAGVGVGVELGPAHPATIVVRIAKVTTVTNSLDCIVPLLLTYLTKKGTNHYYTN